MSKFVYSGAPMLPCMFAGLGSTPAPTVSSVTHSSGPLAATANGVTGTGFVSGATVSINGQACTGVVFNSSTSLSFNSPVFIVSGGPFDVVVTNPDTSTGTLPLSYWVVASAFSFGGLVGDWAADFGVTSSGGLVSNVTDQSGLGNDLSATLTARPTLTDTAAPLATGSKYFAFDGVANTLTNAGITLGTHEVSFFAIARNNAAKAYAGLLCYDGWGTSGNFGVMSNSSGADQNALLLRNNTLTSAAADIAGTPWHMVSAVFRDVAANETIWVDNGVPVSDTVGGTISTTGKIEIASILSAFFLECDIAEILLYNVNHEANRLDIEQALKTKWFGGGVAPGLLDSLTLSTTSPTSLAAANVISPQGDLDVGGTLVAGFDADQGAVGADTYLFSAATPDGVIAVRYSQSTGPWAYGNFILEVRGADALDLIQVGFTSGDDISWRAWYRVSTNESGIRITINGVVIEKLGGTTGSALSAATSAWLGRDAANAAPFQAATYTSYQSHNITDTPINLAPEFIATGDSIGATFPYDTSLWGFIYSSAARTSVPGCLNQCLSTSYIEDQKSALDTSMYKGRASVKAVFIQGGINNVNVLNDSAATLLGKYQALVDDIRAAWPSAKIYGQELSPCKSVQTGPQYAVWQSVNTAIGGGGGSPITGLDAVISVPALNDGSDNLAAAYSQDGEHLNQAGKAVAGAAYRTQLLADGLVT